MTFNPSPARAGYAILLLALTILAPALPGRAELLLNEPFTYTNGPLGVVSSGLWAHHSGVVYDELNVAAERAVLQQTESEDMNTAVPGGPYKAGTNVTLYWSFRLTMTNLPTKTTGEYFAHINTSSARARVFATTNGATAGNFRLGIANGSTTPSFVFVSDLPLYSEVFVVAKCDPNTGIGTLWVNPVDETSSYVTAADTGGATTLSTICLRQSTGMGDMFVDDLRVGTTFADVQGTASPTPPLFTSQPRSLTVTAGQVTTLSASATGAKPISYQWYVGQTPLSGQTNSILSFVPADVTNTGVYSLAASNQAEVVFSDPATLIVNSAPEWDGSLKVLTWNVKGNNATNWSVNSPQVQAIGRVINHLMPDVITFNEIPVSYTWEMTNWLTSLLPGWYMATNSGTDSFIRSVIASRFQIVSSKKYLDGVSLAPYGSGSFTRDLFQARIRVPGYEQPVDIFTTHLKATTSAPQADADKRGAETMAISNFIANIYMPTNQGANYLLTGDLNEDVLRPDTNRYTSRLPLQNLANLQTGLQLTRPLNPATGEDYTLSIQTALDVRFDYVLPCSALASNMVSAQVFRSDVLTNLATAQLLSTDNRNASDHLPVMLTFKTPVQPLVVNGPIKLLSWRSMPGETYKIYSTQNPALPFSTWTVESANFAATSWVSRLTFTGTADSGFYKIERVP